MRSSIGVVEFAYSSQRLFPSLGFICFVVRCAFLNLSFLQ